MPPHVPLTYCATPGCPALVRSGHCPDHRQSHDAGQRLYRTARWRALRAWMFAQQPLCAQCLRDGRTAAATDLDHVIPHRGDLARFWDVANLQLLCHDCHARKTARGE